jgi:hypothetical protein
MTAVFMLIAWAGYGNAIWGYCLLKGYDVAWSELMSPVSHYQWPAGGPTQIPDTQTWPTPTKTKATVAAAKGG